MFGVITRRLVTGGVLLLTAFLAADAADIDDDLPDLADQIARMASEAHTGPRGRRDCPVSESGA